MEYVKRNSEEIEIEDIMDDESGEYKLGFRWNDRTYFIDQFIRAHNNPWSSGNFPEYIHGYDSVDYWNPIYIELIGDSAVNVYEGVA